MVEYCGFSERVFEFAFNSEFARKHHSVLAGCPHLPTQQSEKSLGYDVELRIKQVGGAVESLFLQHKICRYVSGRIWVNAHLFDSIGGPYFAFPLNVDQYNVLHKLAHKGVGRVYYCAPCFTTRDAIDKHFNAQNVADESIWIDMCGAAPIASSGSHSIVYCPHVMKAVRHSTDPGTLAISRPSITRVSKTRYEDGLHIGELRRLYETVYSTAREWLPTLRRGDHKQSIDSESAIPQVLPQRIRGGETRQLIEETSDILARYFGVSWIIVGRKSEE